MKIKYIVVTIIINTFLLFLLSFYNEYTKLTLTIQKLDSTIDLAVDSSVSAVIGSEEMFADDTSDTNGLTSSTGKSAILRVMRGNSYDSGAKVWNAGSWITGNMYIMSMYYNVYGTFPETQSDYDNYHDVVVSSSSLKTESCAIYEFMFGDVGSDYNNASLMWANKGHGVSIISGTERMPTPEFDAFYNAVGQDITKNMYVKQKNGNSFALVQKNIPVLEMMGLRLSEDNEVTSSTTSDTFTSSYHAGKDNSSYYLTPYSLGVTYIDGRILKPVILSNIEQLVRFGKTANTPTSLTDSSSVTMKDYASADGCISTSMYNEGSTNSITHSAGSDTKTYISGVTDFINDGDIEYDMNSMKISIDYCNIDFYDDANYKIVNYIEGSTPYSLDLNSLPSRLASTDTSEDTGSDTGNRIVAKVTVTMKVHIPYKSAVLQWFREMNKNSADEHYDIRGYDSSSNSIIETDSGTEYSYTTYVAISR